MAKIVDPTDSKRDAFRRGFWKGMAAPLVLFSSFDMPPSARPGEFQPLPNRVSSRQSEWVRVGNELRAAVKAHKSLG